MLVRFKATANVPADVKNQTWIVARSGKVQGVPCARLIGTDLYGRERCFMTKSEGLDIVGY